MALLRFLICCLQMLCIEVEVWLALDVHLRQPNEVLFDRSRQKHQYVHDAKVGCVKRRRVLVHKLPATETNHPRILKNHN